MEILRKAINVERAVIGIENNKPDAIKHMTQLATDYPAIEICPLKVKYPQGGEKQLIDAVIRRQVPSGALPIATGAVVQNVGTAFAVYEAVQKHKPLVERIVTITGKSLAKPSNLRVRIGTPISQLIDMCGGLPQDTEKVISGGPMMGKSRRIDRHGNDKRLFGRPHNTGSRIETQRNATLYPLCQMRISLSYGTRAERIDECIKFPKLGTCRGRACHGLHRMRLLQFHLSRPPSAARLHTHGKSQSRCHHSQP